MKIEQKEKIILTNKYIAEDGKEFDSKKDCIKYENKIKYGESSVMKSLIDSIYTFWENERCNLVYISDRNDYEIFKSQDKEHCWEEDFEKYGKGWYLYVVDDFGDGPRNQLYNLNHYTEEIKNNFDMWKLMIDKKIKEKTFEMT